MKKEEKKENEENYENEKEKGRDFLFDHSMMFKLIHIYIFLFLNIMNNVKKWFNTLKHSIFIAGA